MTDHLITCAEAGRRGGLATSATHGPEWYRRLAALANAPRGNRAQRAALGEAGMATKAKRGGEALLATRGREWFAEIARRGHPR